MGCGALWLARGQKASKHWPYSVPAKVRASCNFIGFIGFRVYGLACYDFLALPGPRMSFLC